MATPATPSARKHNINKNNKSSSSSSPILTPIFRSLQKTNWKKRFKSTRTSCRFTPNNPTPLSITLPQKPHFVSTTKNVMLLDWWLIKVKVQGSTKNPSAFKFGVGGNAFDGRASMYFCSGEIVKRHDEVTLETGEGILITLSSLLNRFHTLKNGFPSQVCDHFFLGFPFDWEEFGAQYFDGQSIHGARSSEGTRISSDDIDDPKCLLSSFDDIPVTRLFDHMMVSSGDYNECPLTRSVYDHMLGVCGRSSSAELNEEGTDKIIAEDSMPNKTTTQLHASEENNKPPVARRGHSLDKPLKDQPEHKDDNVILDDMPMGITHNIPTVHGQSKMDEDVHKLSKFVLPRSKTRSETLTNYQQEGLPLNTSTYPDTPPRTAAKQYGDTITVTNVATVGESAIPNVENIKVDRILDSSRYKHCSKPKHLKNDVATRGGTISKISTSGQELNFLSATLDLGVSAPISASEVSGNQSRVPQMDMESRALHNSKSIFFGRNLNTSGGVLTRSKARLKKLRTDPEDITAEVDATAEECAVHLVPTKNISDPCSTSEAEKSEKEASNRHVPNKLTKVNNRYLDRSEVRRSGRTRNVVQYR